MARFTPAEENERGEPQSPAEAIAAAASPFDMSVPLTAEGDPVVHRPWSPTGEEQPKKTIEDEKGMEFSPPNPVTAGGAIPSAFAHFRRYGPDES